MKKLVILCGIMVILTVFAVSVQAAALTPAIEVLQTECAVLKTGVGKNTVSFSEEDFLPIVGESEFLGIVITELPALSDGILKLGTVDVGRGQIISKNALRALRFIPNEAGKTASFGFIPYGKNYENGFVCTVYMLDSLNFAPTAAEASLCAIEEIPLYGTLSAKDPDGDPITYQLESAPKNGTLLFNKDGSYCYTPYKNAVGRDSFSYIAVDPYGNHSAPAEVIIETAKNESGIVYSDMKDSETLHSAVVLASKNAFTGEKIGSEWYFYPQKTVTRGEFLVMAMKMNGIETELLAADDSGFADSESFSRAENAYIATAADLGIIVGIDTDKGRCFLPDVPITSVQASTIISRIAGLYGDPFADAVLASASEGAEISEEGMAILSSVGLAVEGEMHQTITRADAAELLCRLSEKH